MKIDRLPSKWLIEVIATAIIYYGAARVGLLLAFQNTNASPVWPPSGIAFAMILIVGYRIWPGIMIGAFLANVVVFLSNRSSDIGSILAVSSFIAIGNTLEAVSGAFLIHRFVGSRNSLDRSRDVFTFVFVALLMCIISSTIGPTTLCLAGMVPWTLYRTVWFTWWLGDTVGVLVLTPFLLTWCKKPLVHWRLRFFVELVLFLVLLFAVCQLVFGQWFPIVIVNYPLAFILIPFIVWTAFRFGQSGVVLSTPLVSGFAIWGTIHGFGPFVRETLNESLWLLQSFVGIVAVTGLILAAVLTERRRMEEALRDSEERYRALYEDIPSMYFTVDSEGKVLSVNKFGAQQLGYTAEELVGQSVLNVFYEEDKKSVLEQVAGCLQNPGQAFHWEFRKVRKDRSILWVREVARAACDTSGNVSILIVCEDITEHKRAEEELQKIQNELEIRVQERTLELAKTNETLQAEITERRWAEEALHREKTFIQLLQMVAVAANEASTIEDVLQFALDQVCARTGWPVGDAYILDKDSDELAHMTIWHFDNPERFEAFRKVTESMRFAPGIGLPGRVLASGKPAWIMDVTKDLNFPRANVAQDSGLRAGFGFPVLIGKEIVAVLEFFSDKTIEPDERLLEVMAHIGTQLGRVVERKRAEEVLHESERRYRLLAENATDNIWTMDMNLRYTYVSPSVTRMRGYSVEEAMVMTANEVLAPSSLEVAIEAFMEELAIESMEQKDLFRSRTLDLELKCKDGSTIWTEIKMTFLRDPDGQPVGILGVTRDITERRRAEEALRESEERFRVLTETANDAIISANSHGNIIYFNKGAERIFGYSVNDIVGKPLTLIMPERFHDAHRHGFKRFVSTGEAHVIGKTLELTGRRKDGSEFPVELSLTNWKIGKETFFTGILRDITERKWAEKALERQAATLREQAQLLDLAYDSIFVRDMNSIITFWNHGAEEMYGWTKEESLGNIAHMLLQTQFPKPLTEIEAEIIRERRWEGELVHTRRDGMRIVVASRWALQCDDHGKPIAILEINSDITERKWAEEEIRKLNEGLEQRVIERTVELETANKELEAFSYSVSHDLRAPLRHIIGYSELLQKSVSSALDEKSRRYLMTISESTKRMGNLIDDLLAFSRVGRSEMQKTKVSLEQLVKEALHDLRNEVDGRNVVSKTGTLPEVYADSSMLRLVLVNLISNALKFTRTRAQAEIEIGSITGKEDEIVFFIRDNGVGFDMRYVDKLFGVFQRLHRAEEFEGTGIGLASVQRIIHRHGGRTWAEGEVDGGATFYFSVPKS